MLRFLFAALALFLMLAVAHAPSQPAKPQADFAGAGVPGRYLVGLTPQGYALNDAILAARLGGRVEGRIEALRVVRLVVDGDDDARATVRRLDASALVAYAEP